MAHRKHWERKLVLQLRQWLLLLLTFDLVFIGLHLQRHLTGWPGTPMFSLTEDGGYAEFYQYAKWGATAGLMLVAARVRDSRGFLAWSALAFYLLLDDALMLHERAGDVLHAIAPFQPVFNLRLEDIGELAASMAVGAVFLVALAREYRRGTPGFRGASQDLLAVLVLLAATGMAVDVAHVALQVGETSGLALTVLEDGGEMVTGSVLCWYSGLIARVGLRRESMPFIRLRPALEGALGAAV